MTLPYGKSSSVSPKVESNRSLTVDTLVVLGVLLSLGLVCVSATLNFRMGYRSADTEIDGWVYGLGAGFGDGIKAIAPFMGFWGLKNRDYLAIICAAALFLVFTSYSFTAALGFASQHRASKQASTLHDIEKHGDLRRQFDRDEDRLELLGNQRPPEQVETDIANLLAKPIGKWTVGSISAKCTLNRVATREACATIASLEGELTKADESKRLIDDERQLRAALDDIKSGNATTEDPQTDALQKLSDFAKHNTTKENIGFGLSFLLACFIELGSGLGLYVVTTPWRGRERPLQPPALPEPERVSRRPRWRRHAVKTSTAVGKLGMVDTYALQRLEPSDTGAVTLADMYADYRVWCTWRKDVPYTEKDFARVFDELAREVGITCLIHKTTRVYQQVKLVGR